MCGGTFPLFLVFTESTRVSGFIPSVQFDSSICRIGLLTRSPVRPSVVALFPPSYGGSRHVSELGPWWRPWSARTCVRPRRHLLPGRPRSRCVRQPAGSVVDTGHLRWGRRRRRDPGGDIPGESSRGTTPCRGPCLDHCARRADGASSPALHSSARRRWPLTSRVPLRAEPSAVGMVSVTGVRSIAPVLVGENHRGREK